MTWQPNCGVATARARAIMLRRARNYFEAREVLEVWTPSLTNCGSTDPNIDSIQALLDDKACYLHTSPEFLMKRLLAAGYPDIYQVCRVFRGAESGPGHQPEFTLIEWYRRGFNLNAIIEDTVTLITTLLESLSLASPRLISYSDVFSHSMSVDPHTIAANALADILHADPHLRNSLGEDRDAWLDLAMATVVSPDFADDRLTAVYHYPASQASLARICPQDAAVADRFEVYLGPVELANGFVELTNPEEQLARFERDREIRATLGKQDVAIDYDFIDALRNGLPECAGVAVGLDRVLMIAEGRNNIGDVATFSPGGQRAG